MYGGVMCLGSNVNTNSNAHHLRTQLDQLHSEADITRSKANNARLRFLRLSEAAEKLRRQAALSVRTGKEDAARQLLFEKKKVIQALEKSKSRIELLDELAGKLNEAISVKESQLVGKVTSDLEVGIEDALSPVHIISPKEESIENLAEEKQLPFDAESEENLPINDEQKGFEDLVSVEIWNEDDPNSNLKGVSSYQEFLKRVDRQLKKIEAEVATVLRLATLVLEDEEKTKNSKVIQTTKILESIRSVRESIANAMQTKVEIR